MRLHLLHAALLVVSSVPYAAAQEVQAAGEALASPQLNTIMSGSEYSELFRPLQMPGPDFSALLEGTLGGQAARDAGMALARDAPKSEQQDWGIDILTNLAAGGDGEASYMLGKLYDAGVAVEQDFTAAIGFYTAAAGMGYAKADWNLGRAYLYGDGVEIDYSTAFKLLDTAYADGADGASLDLARIYQNGWGVQPDAQKSEEFWKASIATEAPEAYLGYADFLLDARPDLDRSEIEPLLRSAAETGQAHEKSLYGSFLLAEGNDAAAFDIFTGLALDGDPLSQAKLGDLFLQGRGARADPFEALRLFRDSAAAGNSFGMAKLGELAFSADRLGLPDLDREQGLALLRDSAAAGEPYAFLAMARAPDDLNLDPIARYRMAAVASELSGGVYTEEANRIKLAVCNESVDTECAPIPVFYITDRQVSEEEDRLQFRNQRDPSGAVRFGVAFVSVPLPEARPAESQGYASIAYHAVLRFFGFENSPPTVEQEDAVIEPRPFEGEIRSFLELARSVGQSNGRDSAFVFIHGFNNTFEDAVTRVALLVEDIKKCLAGFGERRKHRRG